MSVVDTPPMTAGAFAGVFDPRRSDAGERLRDRLPAALEPDSRLRAFDDGRLALSWTAGVGRADAGDGGIQCLLDGHIYNRLDLARELGLPEGTGAAELLASGYAALGAGLLPRLRGDFALLLWDSAAGAGLVARDQLGGRGLFVHRRGSGIAFASEIRQLRRLLPRAPAPDRIAIAHWLVPAAAVPAERTLFEGIEPLAPATCMTFGEDGISTSRYWTPRYRSRSGLDRADAAAEVLASLERAVERRAGSGASNAVLLSGGIDSASVAGVAASSLGEGARPRRSYSAVFPRHPEIDEGALIGAVAARAGLCATGLRVEAGGPLAGALPFLQRWELPPATPNLFFLHPLLRRAGSEGVRVLLDGEGGDAVFWYPTALLAERLRRGRLLSAWSLAGRFPEYGVPTTRRTRLGHLRQWGRRRELRPLEPDWLTAKPSELVDAAPPPPPPPVEGPAWWSAQVEGILGPGSRMLHDTSRRHAALSGIEPRHPLLDVDLIELALSLPPEMAFDRRHNRPVLRRAVEGLVPDEARLRPYKSNFDPVLIDGIRADLPVLERLLLAPGAQVAAHTERDGLERHLASAPKASGGLREWAMTIWQLATLECWLRLCAGEEALPEGLARRLKPPTLHFTKL